MYTFFYFDKRTNHDKSTFDKQVKYKSQKIHSNKYHRYIYGLAGCFEYFSIVKFEQKVNLFFKH